MTNHEYQWIREDKIEPQIVVVRDNQRSLFVRFAEAAASAFIWGCIGWLARSWFVEHTLCLFGNCIFLR
jgi:hypothetical protein